MEGPKTACGHEAVASSASLSPRGFLATVTSVSLEYALPGVSLQLLSLDQTIILRLLSSSRVATAYIRWVKKKIPNPFHVFLLLDF